MSQSDFAKRINYAIERAGGPSALSRTTGYSLSTIRKWTSGESDPSRERLVNLADICDVSLLWLASGEGEPSNQVDRPIFVQVFDQELIAGDGSWLERRQPIASASIDRSMLPHCSELLIGIRLSDDAMTPEIPVHGFAIIDCDERFAEFPANGMYAFSESSSGKDISIRVRLLVRQTEGVLIRSFNRDHYPDEFVSLDAFSRFLIIGKCAAGLKPF